MKTIAFGHLNLRAPRKLLDELFAFYTGVVGLEPGARPPFSRFGYWLYCDGRDIVHLIEASPDENRATGVTTTIDHVAFACEGYTECVQRLQQSGMHFDCASVPLTGQRQLVLRDPAGNKVELNFPGNETSPETGL